MNEKKQIIVIHGGEAWETYDAYFEHLQQYEFTQEKFNKLVLRRWKDRLQEDLGNSCIVLRPDMPCAYNAKFAEWKLWFDKIMPYINDGCVMVGHSLGANFLAKYLAIENISVDIDQLHLVAGCFGYIEGFELPRSLKKIEDVCDDIFIYHSHDDPVVDFSDAQKYKEALPHAHLIAFKDRHHFIGENFPEIVQNIKKVL